MLATLQNSGMLLSMAVFFTIVIVGLSCHLPSALYVGLTRAGLLAGPASGISHLPPTAALFASFLGYNPMGHLLPPALLSHLPAATQAHLLGHSFFPHLIAPPFMDGLRDAFYVSAGMAFVAAIASLLRGKQYFYEEEPARSAVMEGDTRPVVPPRAQTRTPASVGAGLLGEGEQE
jgi:hypothetical protein